MTIGEKILNLRKNKGLSQEQLAEELGISRQAVSKWEAEQSIPDIDKVILLAEFFHVTTDYILRDIDEEKTVNETANELKTNLENTAENTKNRKVSAVLLAIAVMLYIICPAPLFIMQDTTSLVYLLIIVAVATGIIIYRAVFNAKTKPVTNAEKQQKPESNQFKMIKGTITSFTLIIYFLVSFFTGAWHLTWIIFLISGAVKNIVSAVFELKESEKK